MKKVNGLKPQKNIIEIANKCTKKQFVDQLIKQYLNDATNAVESTICMCESVSKMHQAFINKEIASNDIDYFCLTVGLQKNKSQYRKYICIGNHADKFRSQIEKMPKAISVLYEMTTLNSTLFELLINSGKIRPELTLQQLKTLTKKPNKSKVQSANTKKFQTLSISFDYKNLSDKVKHLISNLVQQLHQEGDVKMASPILNQLVIESDEELIESPLEQQF